MLLLLAMGGLAFLVPVQTAEALSATCERHNPAVALVLSVLLWGHASWYFSRILSPFAYPQNGEPSKRLARLRRVLVTWLPRVLGVAPMTIVAWALGRCGDRTVSVRGPAVVLAASIPAFLFLVTIRRRVLGGIREILGNESRLRFLWEDLEGFSEPKKKRFTELPVISLVLLVVHALGWMVCFVWFTRWPVNAGQELGAPTVLALAIATWTVVGSWVLYLSSWLRVPLFLVLIVWAVLISPRTDDHVATPPRPRDPARPRPGISADFAEWNAARGAPSEKPFVIVATEGGGIRAAYWTALLLAALQEHNPAFSRRLYAVSGVSGGSVGAAVFLALLAGRPKESLSRAASDALGVGSLGPALGKMLYPDLLQRLLPRPFPVFDRGEALERSWTDAVDGTLESKGVFSDDFEQLWVDHPSLPRLFLNATPVESGKRVVLSYPAPDGCRDTHDGLAFASFTLAQAAHASARFPYISPADTLPGTIPSGLHLVDGGYFENSGAETAMREEPWPSSSCGRQGCRSSITY